MEDMLGISVYSYPYLNYRKCFVFLIIVYVYSSIKLEKRAKHVLPGSEEGVWEREEAGGSREKSPKYMNK
jgi:hypothetical protein